MFLDEIGNLSLPLQAKLLTVLQNRQVTRLGAGRSTPVDIRLICATNMPLHDMVGSRTFRQDLLYRINTVEVYIPALRDRTDDIPPLVEHFLAVYCKKYKKEAKYMASATMAVLERHPWPGNVRELQHAVERAVILSEGNILEPGDFFLPATAPPVREQTEPAASNLDDIEKEAIRRVLRKHNGNISMAAEELGLTRTSLYRRLKKYNL